MNKKHQKIEKGTYGYLPYQRKKVVLHTIILYAAALLIFTTGYVWTQTKANVFSIIAVLVLLPASRSTVSMIMYLKVPKYQAHIYQQIQSHCDTIPALYELYLTSYQKNFPISCFVVKGNHAIGYTEFAQCDVAACEQHIEGILKQNAVKNVTVKIFQDLSKFEERVEQLKKLERHNQDEAILSCLKDISL